MLILLLDTAVGDRPHTVMVVLLIIGIGLVHVDNRDAFGGID